MNFVVDGIYSIPGAGLGVKENGGEEEKEKRRRGEEVKRRGGDGEIVGL